METDLMIQLERGGLWYHVRASAFVFDGFRYTVKDGDWVKHETTPYAEQQRQQKVIGAVPRLVPSA